MTRYAALLRGVNVGPTTKVPMRVLCELVAALPASDVVTLLNSGNVVFEASTAPVAHSLETAIAAATGVSTRVVILESARLRSIVEAMPFEGDPSRLTISYMNEVPRSIALPDAATLAPEQFVLGADAAYQSLPNGISKTKLTPSFWKQFPAETTVRNLRTSQKLLDLL